MNASTGSSDLVAELRAPCGPNNPLELKGDFLDLPPGALEAVIVGCEANFGSIAEIVKKFAPSLKIKRMVRAPNEYKLQIVEVIV